MTTDTNWVPCVIDIRYEISKSYPHQIRKIADQTLVSESTNNKGYIQCSIGGTTYLKHRVIALQFVENDDPGKFVKARTAKIKAPTWESNIRSSTTVTNLKT